MHETPLVVMYFEYEAEQVESDVRDTHAYAEQETNDVRDTHAYAEQEINDVRDTHAYAPEDDDVQTKATACYAEECFFDVDLKFGIEKSM